MKLKNNRNQKLAPGMTLLELSVVILVLLALISILFIGARAWKRGSDRAANILNIRNVQQAVRGHANVRALKIGDALVSTDILGSGKYLNPPTPPNTEISYTYMSTIPAIGALYTTASYASGSSADYSPPSAMIVEW